MIPVEGHPELFRDETTKAIINVSNDYDKYKQAKELRMKKNKEIDDLKTEVGELKDMIQLILIHLKDSKENIS